MLASQGCVSAVLILSAVDCTVSSTARLGYTTTLQLTVDLGNELSVCCVAGAVCSWWLRQVAKMAWRWACRVALLPTPLVPSTHGKLDQVSSTALQARDGPHRVLALTQCVLRADADY